ncbi:unnamed protein product [Anisakis simplex]|uniref:BZIP domain-containing protein n=1 Tax=Anisakis simplex TaxID=6269 RepID=A0A0M3KIR1_ANISI|nr:unnamed protein product [Anisakis simplex]
MAGRIGEDGNYCSCPPRVTHIEHAMAFAPSLDDASLYGDRGAAVPQQRVAPSMIDRSLKRRQALVKRRKSRGNYANVQAQG